MKIILACLLTFVPWAHAQGDDDELVRALQNLNSRGLYIDSSTRAVVQDRAVKVFVGGSVFGAAMAAANSRLFFGFRKSTSITELYIADGALIAMIGSGLAWVGAEVAKRFERPPVPLSASQYVSSPEGMNEFFRLSIDQQITAAKQDESLKKFVLILSRAYDFTDKRMPDEPSSSEPVQSLPGPNPGNLNGSNSRDTNSRETNQRESHDAPNAAAPTE